MGSKPSSRQQARLEYLRTIPAKLERVRRTIEAMAILQADEASVRSLGRTLDEIKANCQMQGMHALAEVAGNMAMLSRRGGGQQVKVRGLRELLASFMVNFEGAQRAALVPEDDQGEEKPGT